MKFQLILIALLSFAIFACEGAEKNNGSATDAATSAPAENVEPADEVPANEDSKVDTEPMELPEFGTPTARFLSQEEDPIIFEHIQSMEYRLIVPGEGAFVGKLNTRRGYGDDLHGTVFELFPPTEGPASKIAEIASFDLGWRTIDKEGNVIDSVEFVLERDPIQ